MINEKYLKKLRIVQLNILDEVIRICDQNNIQYFLAGGTLLGAIRHKGYIPWDDDVDIGMTRGDYNKFINICETELNDNYYIDCYSTNRKHWFLYAKIKAKNTLFIEEKFKNCSKQEIFIDIFPFDNVDNIDEALQHDKLIDRYQTLLSIKLGLNYYKESKIKRVLYKIILFFVPIKVLTNKIIDNATYNNNEFSKYLSVFNTKYGLVKDSYDRNIFFPLKELEFEGRTLKVPNNYDAMLKQLYKDYMKLPPEDQRVTHNPLMVKFEDGTVFERKDNKMIEKK